MYFKELEICGFKSFPNKTKLKFEPGITAIVGPNGCGKSNVSDSIRWVLGEQSAKTLRGGCMEDVIFNGTASIEPINMAEVSLTLSNESKMLPIDYDEVTITRRLFRSGESEYALNKTPVRLKDISSLLMGTGLGTNSYSIIEQGKIDLILSSKPEDRRFIFEEASGITRYKSKKKEALRKLEHTENNLVRIGDIINEVRRQINSIERHAKKAERYKKDFETMKELDLKLARYELQNITKALEESRAYLEEARKKEGISRLELEGYTASINNCRSELDAVMRDFTDIQKNLSEATLFIDKGRHKIELNGERINDLEGFKARSEAEESRLEKKVKAQEEEIQSVKRRFQDALKNKEEKGKALAQKEVAVENFSHEIEAHLKEVREAKNRTVDLLAFQTKTKNELIKLGADLTNRKTRLRRLETERENVKVEEETARETLACAERELRASKERVRKEAELLDGLKNSLRACEAALGNIVARIRDNTNTLKALESKEELLKDMIANYEGFDNGVRLVMEGAPDGVLYGIIGVVADILEPQAGYESALEAALGKKAQAIVVENKDSLQRALSFLEERKAQAHFIIYEDIKGMAPQNRLRQIMNNIASPELSSFVKLKVPYETLKTYLLKGTYLAESRDEATEIYNAHGENVKFVTKEGLLFEKGHVLGGFAGADTATSIIGRAKKLEDIRNQRVASEKNIESLAASEARERQGVLGLEHKIAEAESLLKREEISSANAMSKKELAEVNFKKITDELSIVKLEITEIDELVHELSFKGEGLNSRLNEKESEYVGVQEFISTAEEQAQKKAKSKNELLFTISEIKSELVFLKNTEEETAKALEKEAKMSEEFKEQYENKKRDVLDSEEKASALREETKDLEKEIDGKRTDEGCLKDELSGISERRIEISKGLRETERVSREKEKEAEELRNQMRNVEIKNRESELMEVNMTDRIRQAYKLDIHDVNAQFDDIASLEDARNEVEVLKIKLEKLGAVNLVAIEEHKELEERYSFLTRQQEDLLQAKETLHKAIVKINKTTMELFIETFRSIQAEFKNYFRLLFGGGHAELLLLDESDVLESGIEIVVRPPGKKLQNLLLLSGGEKALTAMALLFAVFKVKPSPFCILDEVDAPLDESNIGRFTRILHDFTKTSQFIIITHSKRTMQMANILYGITMEQKGVSKIVSVKFANDETKPAENEEVLV
ncbi:MAG: chromosome segregation protein SMC [Omnitrophica bacterium]|nr:chromosome segregation protein SMC [Candidatus Omnitrophota bacterium]